MTSTPKLNRALHLLIALTLGGIVLGENAVPSFGIFLLIAAVTAFKGRLVIDCFMELGDASPTIRRLVRIYGLLVPVLIVVTYLWAPLIARLTRL